MHEHDVRDYAPGEGALMFTVWFVCACVFFLGGVLAVAAVILSSRLGAAERARYPELYDQGQCSGKDG